VPTFRLIFSNAMGFNSEGSQIHGDAQALKLSTLSGRLNRLSWSYFHQLTSDLPAPYSLPEHPASTGASEITPRLPGTGATSTPTTNGTVFTPVKGESVILRVPGLPKDTSAATMAKAAEPETPTSTPSTTTRPRAANEEAPAAGPTLIQPTLSISKTTMSTTTTNTVTRPASTISTTTPFQTAT